MRVPSCQLSKWKTYSATEWISCFCLHYIISFSVDLNLIKIQLRVKKAQTPSLFSPRPFCCVFHEDDKWPAVKLPTVFCLGLQSCKRQELLRVMPFIRPTKISPWEIPTSCIIPGSSQLQNVHSCKTVIHCVTWWAFIDLLYSEP